jgi:hypothetical protein
LFLFLLLLLHLLLLFLHQIQDVHYQKAVSCR